MIGRGASQRLERVLDIFSFTHKTGCKNTMSLFELMSFPNGPYPGLFVRTSKYAPKKQERKRE